MNGRAYAIDVLRCLAIVGMVFSAQIAWVGGMPPYMAHAQVPPPEWSFNPSIAGITWVDLVFPFFLFSMGAAFPLAMRRKMEKGVSSAKITYDLLKRGLLLAFFAVMLGNTGGYLLESGVGFWWKNILLVATWLLFFCTFVRLDRLTARANRLLNLGGVAGLAALFAVYRFGIGLPVALSQYDIIILVLAYITVAGSLLWWLSKESIPLRLGIIALVAAMKLDSGIEGSWVEAVWEWGAPSGLFRVDYLKYLCIALAGSIAGDAIYRWMKSEGVEKGAGDRPQLSAAVYVSAALLAFSVCLNVWALFTRHLVLNAAATVVLGGAALMIMRGARERSDRLHLSLALWGFGFLILGLVLEPLEGGIKKDPATLSYFFVTSGLAFYTLELLSVMLVRGRVNLNFMVRCGQNPLVAYTAANYVVIPLLSMVGIMPLIYNLASLGAWGGIAKGIIVTGLMMVFTWAMTRKKIFLKA